MAGTKGGTPDLTDGVSETVNKGGRPRKLRQDATTLKELRGLGVLQCTIREAAGFFSVSTNTLEGFLNEPLESGDPEAPGTVRDVFEDGKQEGKISLRRKQWRLADKNAAMAIFLGKNHLEQTDRQEHSGPNGGPIPVDIQRLSPEERRARIAELQARQANGPQPD